MEFAKNQSAKLPTYRMGTLLPAHAMCSEGSKRGSNSPNPLHYYVQMPKQGMLLFKTNFAAFADFKVNPRWITGYLQSKKMTVATLWAHKGPEGCVEPYAAHLVAIFGLKRAPFK